MPLPVLAMWVTSRCASDRPRSTIDPAPVTERTTLPTPRVTAWDESCGTALMMPADRTRDCHASHATKTARRTAGIRAVSDRVESVGWGFRPGFDEEVCFQANFSGGHMPAPYSQDLRDRVASAVSSG